MSKFRVGITERGDAGLDFSWVNKLQNTLFSILITKNLNDEFIETVNMYSNEIIVHTTITGYGGSKLEPNVPKPDWSLNQLQKLIDSGFPVEQIVLRVDPIFNSDKGVETSIGIMERGVEMGIKRIRFSIMDTHYIHVQKRFSDAGIEIPPCKPIDSVIKGLEVFALYNKEISIETCAEGFKTDCGCISKKDFEIMGEFVADTIPKNGQGRKNCHCLTCKTELLTCKHPCSHKCLYCYWCD